MSKNTFPTQPILAIPWIKPCNLVVPILTIKIYIYILKKKKKLNQYLYENYKGNRDYDLKSNNEITKVEQLEIEIGKSMMSSIFYIVYGNRIFAHFCIVYGNRILQQKFCYNRILLQ